VNAAEEPVLRKKLRRQDMVAFFTKLAPTVVGLEACGDPTTGRACCGRWGTR
jgi:transposase